jgi:hypothetical protein
MTAEEDGRRQPASYEFRVRGRLGTTMLRAFPALYAEARDGDTLLRGAVADQAALYGVLAQIEALGLELLEVRRLPPEAARSHLLPPVSHRPRAVSPLMARRSCRTSMGRSSRRMAPQVHRRRPRSAHQ